MTQAIEILVEEHRSILKVLDSLEAVVAKVRGGKPCDPGFFSEAVSFIRNYADKSHHAKEEHVLFEHMSKYGLDRDSGPLAVMLHEHTVGRNFTGEMANAAQAISQGDGSRVKDLLGAAEGYASLLRQHIHKEDQVLYVMAERLIPPEAFTDVLKEYAAADTAPAGEIARVAEKLAARAAAL